MESNTETTEMMQAPHLGELPTYGEIDKKLMKMLDKEQEHALWRLWLDTPLTNDDILALGEIFLESWQNIRCIYQVLKRDNEFDDNTETSKLNWRTMQAINDDVVSRLDHVEKAFLFEQRKDSEKYYRNLKFVPERIAKRMDEIKKACPE